MAFRGAGEIFKDFVGIDHILCNLVLPFMFVKQTIFSEIRKTYSANLGYLLLFYESMKTPVPPGGSTTLV